MFTCSNRVTTRGGPTLMHESLQVQCIDGFLSREIMLNQQSTWIKLTTGQRQSQRCLSGLETVPGPLSVPGPCTVSASCVSSTTSTPTQPSKKKRRSQAIPSMPSPLYVRNREVDTTSSTSIAKRSLNFSLNTPSQRRLDVRHRLSGFITCTHKNLIKLAD